MHWLIWRSCSPIVPPNPSELWRLREANRALRCDFFEGVVMKRADSISPCSCAARRRNCGDGPNTASSPNHPRSLAQIFRLINAIRRLNQRASVVRLRMFLEELHKRSGRAGWKFVATRMDECDERSARF
jgi:hypothetical protein